MNASITAEDDQYVGIEVTDNSGKIHDLTLEQKTGDIAYHEQDAYPDQPAERTHEEGEHVSQTRRFAQHYVATETEYDTLPWDLNTDRFETVQNILQSLSSDEIETHFGKLFAQSLSHYSDDPDVDIGEISRPYDLPEDMIGTGNQIIYKQEIYLDKDDALEATSGLIAEYYVAKGQRETTRYGDDQTPDRDPDAQVEIFPAPLVELEPFRDYLVYNLRCQIRDCYLMMGLEPPTADKVLGHGQYRFTGKYHHFDMYPEYHDMTADIPGYSLELEPELPVPIEELGGMTENDGSLVDQIKGALFSR